MIYAQQCDKNMYWLVNERGLCVGLDGELAYYPLMYNGNAEDSGYPVYKAKI